MIKVQLHTGMRSTEICIMRPRDIDRTLTPWVYRPMFHKTQAHGIAREIPIGHQAREVLAQYLEGRDPDSFIFSPAEADQERRRRQREKRDDVPPSQVERSRRAAKCRHTRRRPPRSRYTRTS
jgi:integrase